MKHVLLTGLLAAGLISTTAAAAGPNVASFVKRCDFYQHLGYKDFKNTKGLKAEINQLKKSKVPIRISLESCESIDHVIQLRSGGVARVSSSIGTNKDPDNKGSRHRLLGDGPSKDYWLFEWYDWESAGWELVNKDSGQKIRSPALCSLSEYLKLQGHTIATLCYGSEYEGTQSTIHLIQVSDSDEKRSPEISLPQCLKGEQFHIMRFAFFGESRLQILGGCIFVRESKDKSGRITRKVTGNGRDVLQTIDITLTELVVRSRGEETRLAW